MTDGELAASVSLRRGALSRVGGDRVALIEAIDELGSISAAAKRVGLSYKGAWDAVQALNNLFDAPLITAAPGGKAGGAAHATARGRAVASAFRKVQSEVDAAFARLEAGMEDGAGLFWSLGMRTSARNALRGKVSAVTDGAVSAEVTLDIGEGVRIVAIVTRQSLDDLGLKPGVPAIALIKSSFVLLAKGENLVTSARNQIAGTVARREDGAVNTEVAVAIGGGKTLTAVITLESADTLDLKVGDPVTTLIKAPHVILAVD